MGGLLPPEQHAVEMDHLDLALTVDPERRRIEGVATLTLRTTQALDVLSVDLFPDYGIHEVSIDGNALDASAWSHPDGELRMHLPARTMVGQLVEVRIEYAGSPHVTEAPPWEGGLVWSQDQEGQPIGGANVRVRDLSVSTGPNGAFALQIPGDIVQQDLYLEVSAKGYTPWRELAVPESNEVVVVLRRPVP